MRGRISWEMHLAEDKAHTSERLSDARSTSTSPDVACRRAPSSPRLTARTICAASGASRAAAPPPPPLAPLIEPERARPEDRLEVHRAASSPMTTGLPYKEGAI